MYTDLGPYCMFSVFLCVLLQFYRSGMFVVGPESAGAHPGPACYRKGQWNLKKAIFLISLWVSIWLFLKYFSICVLFYVFSCSIITLLHFLTEININCFILLKKLFWIGAYSNIWIFRKHFLSIDSPLLLIIICTYIEAK